MAESVGEIFYTVRAETEGLVRGEQMATKSLDRLEQGMDRADKTAAGMNTSLSGLARAIAAVVAASALRDMARLVQSYQEMAERVQMATTSQAEFETVQQRLLATANGTYRSLAEAQELFIRTNASLQAMGYTTAQALDVMDSLSYSFVTNATSADRAQAAISAVSKSFNTGKVAADQWETVTSAIPTVIEQIAAASGRTSAEVRALGAAGKLTAQDLSEGLRKALDANTAAAAKMAVNLTDAGVRVRTALQVTLVALEQQTGALQTLTDSLVMAADTMIGFAGDSANIETLMTGLTLAVSSTAAVIAGRLVQALAASAASFYSNTVAAAAKTRADLATAQAATAAAAQELILAQAAERAAVGLSSHAAAAQRLAAAQAAAATATAALTSAQQRMAGVATVAATAVGGLRAALAFLGGPAGVLLLAAGAVFTFATRTEQAKPPTDALAASVGSLGTAAERAAARFRGLTADIDKLTKTELAARRTQLEDQLANAERQLVSFRRQFERGVGTTEQIKGAEAAVVELRKALDSLSTAKPVDVVTLTPPATVEPGKPSAAQNEAARQADAIQDQVASLRRQAETLGMTETELELYKLQLAGATDEQIRAAASSRALIDAFEQQATAEKAAADAAAEAQRKRAEQRQALGQADPLAGEQIRFEDQIAQLRALNEAKLIEDQRYLDLKTQAEYAHAEQMRVLQEENFARQSTGNALLIGTLNELQSAATSAFTGILTGATNGEEAVRALANGILNQAVGALVEMGAQYVKNLIIGQTAAAAATATGVATAGALASAYATPAALASLASFGANAAPASAGIASTVALAQGLGAIPGRRYGGPVAADGMYRVNENGRPEVFQGANGQQFMLPNQRGEVVSNEDAAGGQGGAGVNVVVNINQSAEKAGTMARTNDGETEMIDIFVADIMGDGRSARAISSKFGVKPVGR